MFTQREKPDCLREIIESMGDVSAASGGGPGLFRRPECPARTSGRHADGASLPVAADSRLAPVGEFRKFIPVGSSPPGRLVWRSSRCQSGEAIMDRVAALHLPLFRSTIDCFQQKFADAMTNMKKSGESSRILGSDPRQRERRTSSVGDIEELRSLADGRYRFIRFERGGAPGAREQLASMRGG